MYDNKFGFLKILIIASIIIVVFNIISGSQKIKIDSNLNSNKYWKEAIVSPKPVFLYFYGDYCGTCQSFKPLVYDLANEYSGKLTFLPVDVEDEDSYELSRKFKITAVPTMFVVNHLTGKYIKLALTDDPAYYREKFDEYTKNS